MSGNYRKKMSRKGSRKVWNKNAGKQHRGNEPSRKTGGRRR